MVGRQQALAERFKVGDVVQRCLSHWNGSGKPSDGNKEPGQVIGVIRPVCAEGPLWVSNGSSGFTYFHDFARYRSLVYAAAAVRWFDEALSVEQVRPDCLSRFDAQAWNEEQRAWLAEQQVLLEKFQLGDAVYRAFPKANAEDKGRVTLLVAPVPGPIWGVQADGSFGFLSDSPTKPSKAKARIRWIKDGSTKYSVVCLENLAKVSEME